MSEEKEAPKFAFSWDGGRAKLREVYELGKKQLNLVLADGAGILKEGGKEALEVAKWARDQYHAAVLELDRNVVKLDRFKINAQRIAETLESKLATIANKVAHGILKAIIDGVNMLVTAVTGLIKI